MFPGRKKKNVSKCRLLKILPRVKSTQKYLILPVLNFKLLNASVWEGSGKDLLFLQQVGEGGMSVFLFFSVLLFTFSFINIFSFFPLLY